jgi:hypothetical protein
MVRMGVLMVGGCLDGDGNVNVFKLICIYENVRENPINR